MKRKFAFVAIFAIAACSEQPTQADLSFEPQLAVLASSNTKRPFVAEVINPCNGEAVTLTGEIHEKFMVQADNGGGLRISVHANPQSVNGVSASGVQYTANGASNSTQQIKPGAAETETYINIFNLVGQGSDNNFQVREHVHITINANGEPATVVSKIDTSCK